MRRTVPGDESVVNGKDLFLAMSGGVFAFSRPWCCLSARGFDSYTFCVFQTRDDDAHFLSPRANCLGNPVSADCDSSSEDFQGESWSASPGSILHCACEEGRGDERPSLRCERSCATCGRAAEGEGPVAISVTDNTPASASADQFRAIGLPHECARQAQQATVRLVFSVIGAGQQASTVAAAQGGIYPCEPVPLSSTSTSARGKRKRHRRTAWRILILLDRFASQGVVLVMIAIHHIVTSSQGVVLVMIAIHHIVTSCHTYLVGRRPSYEGDESRSKDRSASFPGRRRRMLSRTRSRGDRRAGRAGRGEGDHGPGLRPALCLEEAGQTASQSQESRRGFTARARPHDPLR
jgi:hypothetical protein